MPSMRHSPPRSGGCYGRLVMRGTGLGDSDDEYESSLEPTSGFYGKRIKTKVSNGHTNRTGNSSVSSQSPRTQHTSDVSVSTPMSPIGERIVHCKAVAKRVCVFMLTNVFISILLLIVGIGLSLGPGLHSLLVVEPAPTIDKSLNAFNIPNHIVSRRQDALTVAKNPTKRRSRNKRDLDSEFEHPSSESLPHSNQVYIPSYHELLGRDIIEPLKSYFLKGDEPLIDIMDMSSKEPTVRRIRRSVLKEHIRQSVRHAFADDPAEEEGVDDTHLNREKRDARKIRGVTQAFRTWKMQVVYLAVSGSEPNVFTESNIDHINHVETMIKEQKGFTGFCYISYSKWNDDRNLDRYQGCAPINSLMTYFYPSLNKDNGKIQYDGLGKIQEPIDRTLSFAMTRDTFFWYVDDKINNTYRKSRLLRSEVQFGSPLAGNISVYVCLHVYQQKVELFSFSDTNRIVSLFQEPFLL